MHKELTYKHNWKWHSLLPCAYTWMSMVQYFYQTRRGAWAYINISGQDLILEWLQMKATKYFLIQLKQPRTALQHCKLETNTAWLTQW